MRSGYHGIIDHYEQCLAKHGDSHLGVDWPNAMDAETRYRVMLELIPSTEEQPVSLLDFGCGAGHLCEYINQRRRANIHYVGVDASASFVALSQRKFPAATFQCLDVLAGNVALPHADYVVMNGVLTEKRDLTFDEMFEYMSLLLQRVYAAARRGLAFNVMSHHVDWQRDDLFHVPYDLMAAFLKTNLSRHFSFRADYGLYEYTTYVYREPQ